MRLDYALAWRGGDAGLGAAELVGERAQLVERAVVVVERPRGPESSAHERAVALGQVPGHVALR